MTLPSDFAILVTPEEMPTLSSGTLRTAEDITGAIVRPMPTPATSRRTTTSATAESA
ncbi:hypothetical protein D3C73_630070 [compost metagenome]